MPFFYTINFHPLVHQRHLAAAWWTNIDKRCVAYTDETILKVVHGWHKNFVFQNLKLCWHACINQHSSVNACVHACSACISETMSFLSKRVFLNFFRKIRDAPLINISSTNRRQMALMHEGVEIYGIEKRQGFKCNFRALFTKNYF